jgi:hypothetical protein
MTKAKTTKQEPKGLQVKAKPDETEEQTMSRVALLPSVNGASVIQAYQSNVMGDTDLNALVDGLRDTFKEVNSGDLTSLEAMLISQATALQTMFTSLARRASHQEQLKHYGVFMGLALKAQAQSRATISALVDLKYPRQATFVKQANIAHGPQQVNNGAGPAPVSASLYAHAEETKTAQPELLEADQHGGTNLDTGATSTASGVDPHMATVEAVNRPEDTRGQSHGRTQRRPGRGAG